MKKRTETYTTIVLETFGDAKLIKSFLIGLIAASLVTSCTQKPDQNSPTPLKKKAQSSEHNRSNSDGEDAAEQARQRLQIEKEAKESTNGEQGAREKIDSETEGAANGRLTYKDFDATINEAKINEWVAADKAKRGADAQNYRYAVIPPYFAGDKEKANYARVALSKAMNSVSPDATDIVSPEDISEGYGVVYALNLPAFWGSRAIQKWNIVASARTKRIFSPAPRLDLAAFNADQPIAADRLVYNLLHGGIYNQLLDILPNGGQQKRKIGAGEVTVKMAVKNAITIGPRYNQRRALKNWEGSYWESFDQFNGQRGMEIPYISQDRLPRFRGDGMLADFGTVASEAWNHMKNGMIAYYIWGNANQERSKAEQSFVVDPLNNKGGALVNGFCIFCHVSAVQSAPNDIWTNINEGTVTGQHAERLKQFFTPPDALSLQYAKDRAIFERAMRKVVYGISDSEDKWNDAVVTGADPKEPCYFLVSQITRNRLEGVVRGNNTKEALSRRGSRY